MSENIHKHFRCSGCKIPILCSSLLVRSVRFIPTHVLNFVQLCEQNVYSSLTMYGITNILHLVYQKILFVSRMKILCTRGVIQELWLAKISIFLLNTKSIVPYSYFGPFSFILNCNNIKYKIILYY